MLSKFWNAIVTNRIVWVVVAVVAAFLLWNSVVTELNPTTRTKILFDIEYVGEEQIEDDQLRLDQDSPTQIYMRVEGTYNEVSKLQENAVLTIDVASVTMSGEHKLKYTVKNSASITSGPTVLTEEGEDRITLKFDEIKSKDVNILFNSNNTIEFEVEDGYNYDSSNSSIDTNTVNISGPADIIDSIDHARVASLTLQDPLDSTQKLERPIEFVLTSNSGTVENQILSKEDQGKITASVETVVVTITINSIKSVKLDVEFIYGGGATESNVKYKISPSTVEVIGDSETLGTIGNILLGKIDLSTYEQNDIEQSFEIKYPEGTTGKDAIDSATVTVEIDGVTTRQVKVTNISVTNVPEGYDYDLQTEELSVTLRGPQDLLNSLEEINVRAIADLTDVTTVGSLSQPVKIAVDGEQYSEVGAINKDTNKVTIVLTRKN